jgi:hypothetical protein
MSKQTDAQQYARGVTDAKLKEAARMCRARGTYQGDELFIGLAEVFEELLTERTFRNASQGDSRNEKA